MDQLSGGGSLIRDGEIIEEVQLKSTDTPHLVEEHFNKYPDIPVAATTEAATQMDRVRDSGFSDKELSKDVQETFNDLSDESPMGHAEDVMMTSGLLSAAIQAKDVLQGKKSVHAAGDKALQDMGVAVTGSFLADLMFS